MTTSHDTSPAEYTPPGSFVKLYATIVDSSLWLEADGTRILWITMLAIADAHGYVRASVAGLARRANITRDACEEGLRVLMAPDPDSRTEQHEGRRVEQIDAGTWLILNLKAYRDMRTPKQIADADRQRRHRHAVTERDTSRVSQPVTPVTPRSLSISQSVSSALDLEKTKEPVGREKRVHSVLDVSRFGDYEPDVAAFLRSMRSPETVAAVLASHLTDIHGPASPPDAVGLAVREWVASGEERFNARHFAGFVRRAEKVIAGRTGRVQARQEERFITDEQVETERARREEAAVVELTIEFARQHGDVYEALCERAEASVDRRATGMFRTLAVRAALVKLIHEYQARGGQ